MAQELSQQVLSGLMGGGGGGSASTADNIHEQLELTKIVVPDVSGDEHVQGQPGSKMKRLRRMVGEADRKRARLEELRAGGAEGKEK